MTQLPDLSERPLSFYNIKMKGGPNPFRNAMSGHLERCRNQENITVFVKDNEIQGIIVPYLRFNDDGTGEALNIIEDEDLGSIGNFAAAMRKGHSNLLEREGNLPVYVKRGQATFCYGFYAPPGNFGDLEKQGVVPKIEIPTDTKLDYSDIEKLLNKPADVAGNEEGANWLDYYGLEINPFHPDMDIPTSRIRSELFLDQPQRAFEALAYLDGADIAIIRERARDGEMKVIGMLSRTDMDYEADDLEDAAATPTQIFPERGGPTSESFGAAVHNPAPPAEEPESDDTAPEDEAVLEESDSVVNCTEMVELYKLGIKQKRDADVLPLLADGNGAILASLGAVGILVSKQTFEQTLQQHFEGEEIEGSAITTFAKSGISLTESVSDKTASITRIKYRDGEDLYFVPLQQAAGLLAEEMIALPNHVQMAHVWLQKNGEESQPLMAAQ